MALISSDILCLRLSLPDVFETLSFSSKKVKQSRYRPGVAQKVPGS
jgi:hypothetical protein